MATRSEKDGEKDAGGGCRIDGARGRNGMCGDECSLERLRWKMRDRESREEEKKATEALLGLKVEM